MENAFVNPTYDENDSEVGQQQQQQNETAHSRFMRMNSSGSLDLNGSVSSTGSQLTERRKKKQRLPRFKGAGSVSARLLEQQKKDLEVHIIDKIARYVYPISFLVFNVIYFTYAIIHRYG